MCPDIISDSAPCQQHMFFYGFKRQPELMGDVFVFHTGAATQHVYFLLLRRQLADRLLQHAEILFGQAIGRIVSIDGRGSIFQPSLLFELLPGQFLKHVKNLIPGHRKEIGLKMIDVCEGRSVSPDFQEHILRNFLCEFRRFGEAKNKGTELLVMPVKHTGKRFLIPGSYG